MSKFRRWWLNLSNYISTSIFSVSNISAEKIKNYLATIPFSISLHMYLPFTCTKVDIPCGMKYIINWIGLESLERWLLHFLGLYWIIYPPYNLLTLTQSTQKSIPTDARKKILLFQSNLLSCYREINRFSCMGTVIALQNIISDLNHLYNGIYLSVSHYTKQ